MATHNQHFRRSPLNRLGILGIPVLLAFACGTSKDDTADGGTDQDFSGGTGSGASAGGGRASGGESSETGGSPGPAGGTDGAGGIEAPGGGQGGEGQGGFTGSGGDDGGGGSTEEGSGGNESGDDEFFGASRCAAANLLLCDGFEGPTIDSSLWNVDKASQNTLEITTEYAARGSQSVHIRADNGYAFVTNESIFPVANNDLYGRMFLRVQRFSTVDWAHWTVAEGAGTTNDSKIRVGGQYIRTDFDANTWANRWGVGSDGGETGDWTRADADPEGNVEEPPTAEWVCLEWQHLGSVNETRFYLNGFEHPSLSTQADDHGGESGQYILPEMTNFWFGWVQYQEDPEPFDVWIDEVALDDERIGCSL